MDEDKWDVVACGFNGDSSVCRMKIHSGWILKIENTTEESINYSYIKDIRHRWELK